MYVSTRQKNPFFILWHFSHHKFDCMNRIPSYENILSRADMYQMYIVCSHAHQVKFEWLFLLLQFLVSAPHTYRHSIRVPQPLCYPGSWISFGLPARTIMEHGFPICWLLLPESYWWPHQFNWFDIWYSKQEFSPAAKSLSPGLEHPTAIRSPCWAHHDIVDSLDVWAGLT